MNQHEQPPDSNSLAVVLSLKANGGRVKDGQLRRSAGDTYPQEIHLSSLF